MGADNIDELIDLSAGSSARFELTALVDPSFRGTIFNTASVTAPMDVGDPDLTNNSDMAMTIVDGVFQDGFE